MATITQTISPFPTAPDSSKDTPPEFNAKADAFVNHQSGVYVAEVNNWATQANTLKDEVNDAKTYIDNVIASIPAGTVNDTVISPTTVWSSAKTSDELSKAKPINNTAIGNINSTLLDLPLKTSLDIKQGVGQVTLTRATAATYIDRYGVMKNAAVDEPRFEKDGLLIEGASTNMHLHGEMDSGWASARSTIAYNADVDPSGANKAAKITVSEVGVVYAYIHNATKAGTKYSYSIFVKNISTSGKFRLSFHGNTFGSTKNATFDLNTGTLDSFDSEDARIQKLDNGWFRLSITDTATTDTTSDYTGILYLSDYGVVGQEFLAYGAQFEEQPFATSYIPTTTSSVTRAADILLCDAFNNHPSIEAGSPFSFAIDASIYGNTISALDRTFYSLGFLEQGVSGNSLLRVTSNGRDVHYYRDGAPDTAIHGINDGETYRVVVTVSAAQEVKIYVDGKLVSSSTRSLVTEGNMASKISIGCSAIGTQQIGGVISNFRVWDKELSEEEARLA